MASPNPHVGGHPLEPLVLSQADPRARGRAHGEHWRQAIHELAELRLALTRQRSRFGHDHEVLAAAALHLPVLREQLPRLAEELEGIAEGADLSSERVLVLNHDTGLRGLPRAVLGGEDREVGEGREGAGAQAGSGVDVGGGTAIYFNGVRGPLLGETWDVHADAEPYVRMLRIAPEGSDHEVLCLTFAGCLGVAGMNSRGVAVTMSELWCTDARVGVVGPALLRALLEQPHARAAYERLRSIPRSSGHYVVLADGHDYYGVETSGELQVLTQLGPRAAHLHTNHCFDPVLRRREAVPRASTTFHRLNLATTIYAQQRPRDAEGLWSLLHTRDGTPGSLCIDPRADEASAPATCAVIVMRLHDGWVRVVRGGEHRQPALELQVGRWQGQPAPAG